MFGRTSEGLADGNTPSVNSILAILEKQKVMTVGSVRLCARELKGAAYLTRSECGGRNRNKFS